ncbi:MAG: hypothetical protein H6Q74_1298 [Firmicutes bacterium]|nr:hypothetical protein [Bacillota bacterium]
MFVVKSNEGTVYEALNHFNMWGTRKIGSPEGAQNVTVSISEFLPNGGATMSASAKERIYCVLRGAVTIGDEAGNKHELNENDMIYIPPNEKRDMAVNGIVAARVLVIVINIKS